MKAKFPIKPSTGTPQHFLSDVQMKRYSIYVNTEPPLGSLACTNYPDWFTKVKVDSESRVIYWKAIIEFGEPRCTRKV